MNSRTNALRPIRLLATMIALAAVASAPTMAAPEAGARRDAQTGQARAPTAAEARVLNAAAANVRAAQGQGRVGMATGTIDPQPVTHANGMVSLELDESTLVHSVARRRADGSIEMVCVHGDEAAHKAATAAPFANRPVSNAAAKGELK